MFRIKQTLGQKGEDLAVNYLIRAGYKILNRNFKNIVGEIDIVAQENDCLCFVEVKYRTTDRWGKPFEAIAETKQRKLVMLAESYLKFYKILNTRIRFDAVAVLEKQGFPPEIELIRGAFDSYH